MMMKYDESVDLGYTPCLDYLSLSCWAVFFVRGPLLAGARKRWGPNLLLETSGGECDW